MPATIHGKDRVLVFAGGKSDPPTGGLLCIDPQNGDLHGEFPWRARMFASVNAASPVAVGNAAFVTECYTEGGALVDFAADGRVKPRWTARQFGSHFTTPVAHDGHLYGVAGSGGTELVCYEIESGRELWRDPVNLEGARLGRAGLLRIDGAFLCLGAQGNLLWLDLTPEGVKILSQARLFRAPETWGVPAVCRGLLYVNQNAMGSRLVCYDFARLDDVLRPNGTLHTSPEHRGLDPRPSAEHSFVFHFLPLTPQLVMKLRDLAHVVIHLEIDRRLPDVGGGFLPPADGLEVETQVEVRVTELVAQFLTFRPGPGGGQDRVGVGGPGKQSVHLLHGNPGVAGDRDESLPRLLDRAILGANHAQEVPRRVLNVVTVHLLVALELGHAEFILPGIIKCDPGAASDRAPASAPVQSPGPNRQSPSLTRPAKKCSVPRRCRAAGSSPMSSPGSPWTREPRNNSQLAARNHGGRVMYLSSLMPHGTKAAPGPQALARQASDHGGLIAEYRLLIFEVRSELEAELRALPSSLQKSEIVDRQSSINRISKPDLTVTAFCFRGFQRREHQAAPRSSRARPAGRSRAASTLPKSGFLVTCRPRRLRNRAR